MKRLSFNKQFLDDLLASRKQQTSRKKRKITYEVGEQIGINLPPMGGKISKQPIRKLTSTGKNCYWNNHLFWNTPCPVENSYFVYRLGIVTLTNIYEFKPIEHMSDSDHDEDFLDRWARADSFENRYEAAKWFCEAYGIDWMDKTYVVLQWKKWDKVSFYAED